MNLKEASYASTVIPEGIINVKELKKRKDILNLMDYRVFSYVVRENFDYVCTPEYAKAHEGKDFFCCNEEIYWIANSGEIRLLKEIKNLVSSSHTAIKEVSTIFEKKIEQPLVAACGGNVKNFAPDVADCIENFKISLEDVLMSIRENITPEDVADQLKLLTVFVWRK